MNIQAQIDALMTAIEKGQRMEDIMRADEIKMGRRIIRPGEVAWLSSDDWHHSIVVSQERQTIRLIALLALRPGQGALRRTVQGILAAGLTPCIVAPTREMRATVKRWGWVRKDVGNGWNHEELWRPKKPRRAPAVIASTGDQP